MEFHTDNFNLSVSATLKIKGPLYIFIDEKNGSNTISIPVTKSAVKKILNRANGKTVNITVLTDLKSQGKSVFIHNFSL